MTHWREQYIQLLILYEFVCVCTCTCTPSSVHEGCVYCWYNVLYCFLKCCIVYMLVSECLPASMHYLTVLVNLPVLSCLFVSLYHCVCLLGLSAWLTWWRSNGAPCDVIRGHNVWHGNGEPLLSSPHFVRIMTCLYSLLQPLWHYAPLSVMSSLQYFHTQCSSSLSCMCVEWNT